MDGILSYIVSVVSLWNANTFFTRRSELNDRSLIALVAGITKTKDTTVHTSDNNVF